jgi:hypothetical protein
MGNTQNTKPEGGRLIMANFMLDWDSRRLLREFSAEHSMSMSEVVRMGIRAVCEPGPAA